MNKKLNPFFVTGFTEGEGSFYVGISLRVRNKTGFEIRPSFSLSQNEKEKKLLYLVKEFFHCGSIRFNKRDKTLKYEVRSLSDLQNKIIPHFQKFPLRGEKKRDFKIFKKIIKMISCQEHLKKEGLRRIVRMVQKMRIRNKWRLEKLNQIHTLLKE
jgi:hypothetical protein